MHRRNKEKASGGRSPQEKQINNAQRPKAVAARVYLRFLFFIFIYNYYI